LAGVEKDLKLEIKVQKQLDGVAEISRIRHPLPMRIKVLVGGVEKGLKLKIRFKNFLTGWRKSVKFATRCRRGSRFWSVGLRRV
jgi:hypothetical protein